MVKAVSSPVFWLVSAILFIVLFGACQRDTLERFWPIPNRGKSKSGQEHDVMVAMCFCSPIPSLELWLHSIHHERVILA